ncbi:hypothetical protein POM88_050659 [Heracleum sosnowskyi]|uniref:Uncharacterized protein n=1 Tax=Heracleum sosnowskyi TaxID=360622 RepID=A0AAD8H0H4_9APIA|nr:hypothetical protein POM88_050659 [Heracleum sosnowskyi]
MIREHWTTTILALILISEDGTEYIVEEMQDRMKLLMVKVIVIPLLMARSFGSRNVNTKCAKCDRIKLKKTNAWFSFLKVYVAGEDEEKLDIVSVVLDKTNSKITESKINSTIQGNTDIADKSKIKMNQEIFIEEGNNKRRKCSKCGMISSHNARSCPSNKH